MMIIDNTLYSKLKSLAFININVLTLGKMLNVYYSPYLDLKIIRNRIIQFA